MDLQKDCNYEYVHNHYNNSWFFKLCFLVKNTQNDKHKKDHLINLDSIVLTNRMTYYLIGLNLYLN
jgi:hypothetical protein